MSSDPFSVTLKTSVNTRALLSDRVPSPIPRDDIAPSLSALHRGIHTTYDAAYSSVPARTDPSEGNRYLTLLRSTRGGKEPTDTVMEKSRGAIVVDGAVPVHSVQKETELVSVRHEPRDWETVQQASTREVRPVAVHDFYSTARKIERVDDDHRGGLVGNTQRTVDIMRKRALQPALCPPADVYRLPRPVQMQRENDIHGLPARCCLDIVNCTQLHAGTEAEYAFDAPPLARLSSANVVPVATAVMETTHTTAPEIAHVMCKEATRARTTAPPMDMSTYLSRTNAASTMVEIPQALSVQERIITRMGTTRPLLAGTAKVHESALPHYTGHVPAHQHNVAMQHGNDDDPLRVWSNSYMTLAVHGGGVCSALTSNNPLVGRRGGTRSRPPKTLPPKSDAAIDATVEGSMLHATFTATSPAERAINQRVRERSTLFS